MGGLAIVFWGTGGIVKDSGSPLEIGDINEVLTGNGVLHEGRNTLQVRSRISPSLVLKILTHLYFELLACRATVLT
jgi:hypothetical protein